MTTRQSQTKKKPERKHMDWMAYLTEDMDKEPRNPQEMTAMGTRSLFRTLHFLAWIYWKTLGFAWKGIKEVYHMVLGRGKKKKKQEVQQVPFMNLPPALPSEMATSGLGGLQPPQAYPPQAQYPQQIQQPQQIPQPPAPPVPQMQQPAPVPIGEQARAVQNPFIQIEKSFEQIRESFSHIYEKIQDMEKEIDDIYARLNMLQGVQPRPEKRIVFRGSK